MPTDLPRARDVPLDPVSFRPRIFLRETCRAWLLVHGLMARQPYRPRAA